MSIIRYVYAACDLLAIGAGTVVLFGLLTGELIGKWAASFLKYTVDTSVIGLFFPSHAFMLVKSCSMLSILVSGMALLAWRMSHLSGIWRSIFALTTTIVLYLNVVVAIDRFFMQMSRFTGLAPAQSELTFRATQFFVMLLFVVIGIVAVKRFHRRDLAHCAPANGVTDKHV